MGAHGRRRPLAAHQGGTRHEPGSTRARCRGDGAMKLLAALDASSVQVVLFDIDDTLTTSGKLTAEAYGALEELKRAGKLVVPVTGRPAGWCDHIARMWPVDAVIGENGAFYMRYDDVARKLVRRFAVSEAERVAQRARLATIGAEITRDVAGCALASDQHYRETDLAIDHCEDVPPLPRATI